MGTNTQLYDFDFYLWCLDTCATLGAREFEALDIHHLIEEIRDLGSNLKSVLESDLCQVLLHLLKWRYQPQWYVDSHSWQDSIEEHRERISRLLAKSPSLKSHLPVVWPEEYRRARRKAQRQTGLPLSTFPEVCPWTARRSLTKNSGRRPRQTSARGYRAPVKYACLLPPPAREGTGSAATDYLTNYWAQTRKSVFPVYAQYRQHCAENDYD